MREGRPWTRIILLTLLLGVSAALPRGWQISGLYRFGALWIALSECPAFDDYLSGSGPTADHALRRLGDRLRERRGPTTGEGR